VDREQCEREQFKPVVASLEGNAVTATSSMSRLRLRNHGLHCR